MGPESLFQASARRLSGNGFAAPVVATGDSFRFVVTEQLAAVHLSAAAILIEPDGRNTAPAILAAALWVAARDPDALMITAPSDHLIPDAEAFRTAVFSACSAANDGRIVTFGIRPTRAETGYGYLQLASVPGGPAGSPQPLARFVEKPDAAHAAAMAASGGCLWNAGIFLFTARTMIRAFEARAPDMIAPALNALTEARQDLGYTRLAPQHWAKLPDISIDRAIMEKEETLSVMPYAGAWTDLGSWESVWHESGPDGDGNVISRNATAIGCRNTLLRSEHEGMELVGLGLDGIVAVATSDAVLVARKPDGQRVKEAVIALMAKGAGQAADFQRDHRPWGWFERLVSGHGFQVKRILVHPGASLSLQSHRHRSEHWIVVQGTARVTIGDEVRCLAENQSVFIPLGQRHRLANPSGSPLMLIEVQTGSYLGEDDIIRHEDLYARQ